MARRRRHGRHIHLRLGRSVSFVHRSSDDLVLALICSLAVIGRRKWPLPSLAVVTLSFATLTGLNGAPIGLSVALALVAYTAASRERRPVSIWALVAAEIASCDLHRRDRAVAALSRRPRSKVCSCSRPPGS